MEEKDVVYEGYFSQPGHGGKQGLLRMLVDYEVGKIFVIRAESEPYRPVRTLVSRFTEPDDGDWRAGHGVAFAQAREHLEDSIVMLGRLGFVELPGSPGWLKPLPCIFQSYLNYERARHPLPVMH